MTHSHGLKKVGGAALVLFAAFALAGCGGSDDDDSTDAPEPAEAGVVPASAFASVQSFFDFQKSLAATENAEALRLSDLAAPLDDTAEPMPIV